MELFISIALFVGLMVFFELRERRKRKAKFPPDEFERVRAVQDDQRGLLAQFENRIKALEDGLVEKGSHSERIFRLEKEVLWPVWKKSWTKASKAKKSKRKPK